MEFRIIENSSLGGTGCTFYDIQLRDGSTLFENFLKSNSTNHKNQVLDILSRLKSIAKLGAREVFFKLNYGKPGDGVCALYDNNQKVRLMCIRFSNVAIILGDGGRKFKKQLAIQDNPELELIRNQLVIISQKITKRIMDGDLKLIDSKLIGDLNFLNE